jgi:2-keto-4-pentenoate hydratase/2-oxohepta-3-ene-1,7-dioic acid hydratase in catechol pathway
MKVVRFLDNGKPAVGLVRAIGDGHLTVSNVSSLLSHDQCERPEAALKYLRFIDEKLGADDVVVELSLSELLPPVGNPSKLLCAAMNYHEHVAEIGAREFDKSGIVPKLFLKPNSSLLPPIGNLSLPAVSDAVDWELELAVIIGDSGRHISIDDALNHVGGYTVFNDISARRMHWGLDKRVESHWAEFFDWLMGKWPDGFAPCGPWIISADEVPNPQDLQLKLTVNGIAKQDSNTSAMIFSVAELVSFASKFMTLESGDVIATGTPSGVGVVTNTFLSAGDVVVGEIQGVGAIKTSVNK